MVDVHTRAQRSYNMARIRGRDTKPELAVRRLLHKAGYRYRLHRRDLPGKPDIVFPARRKVILVHGCFWHGHDCKFGLVTPATNVTFWQKKIAANVRRDSRNVELLAKAGWQTLVVWECEMRSCSISGSLTKFLGPAGGRAALKR